jgi:replicative DNA helicase
MRRLLEEFIPKYEAGDYNLDDLIDPVTQLQRGIERDRFESNDSLASTRRRAIARIQREEIPEVATLIAPLDSTMVGIRPGQLGTIMSPSGIGKSFMMVHLGKAAVMQSCGVFHYTLEMSEEEILDRYDQMILGATERELRFPDVMKRLVDKTNRMLNGGGRLQVVYLPFGYGGQQSGTKIEAFRRDFKRRVAEAGRPNLVLIDYGDLLAKDGKSRYEEQGTVWRALKAFAVEEKVAVWAATQSARSGVGVKRVTELEVADSYEKVRVSDIFIGFNRNIIYNRNQNEWMEIDAEHNENVVRLFVVKHRGRRDKYEVKFACDFARGIFYSKVDTASIGAGQSTKPQMGRVKAVFGSKKA